jgi:hypothetical protein
MTLDEWYGRYGTPQLRDDFRDDGVALHSGRSRFRIEAATAEEGKAAGWYVLEEGERYCRLSRLVGRKLSVIIVPVGNDRVPKLNLASDIELKWLWGQLLAFGIKPVTVQV